jgi:hypothetical protein
MRMIHSLLGSIVLCGWAGVAFADGDDPTGEPPTAAAAEPSRWPSGVIDRPATLPAGLLLVGSDVLATNTLAVTMTSSSSSLVQTAALAVGYGVTDALEINTLTPTYGLTLDPNGTAKGALDVGAGLKLLRGALGGKLEVIARAIAGYDFNGSAVRPIRLGAHLQYNVTPRFAILSHDVGVGNAGIAIGVDGASKPIFLTLPIGIAVQATPALWIEADTALVPSAKINSDATNAFISDVTPLFVTGIYNTLDGRLDVLGYLGFNDAQHADDTIFFGAGARYYVGRR